MENIQSNLIAMGARKSPIDVRDYKLVLGKASEELPTTFELARIPIKNQGSASTCVAHALSEAIEYYNLVQLGRKTEMSINYIYGNRRNTAYKDEGMVLRDAIKSIKNYGDVLREDCSGNGNAKQAIQKFEACVDELEEVGKKNRISFYVHLYNEEEIKHFLYEYGPVVIAMTWHDDMKVSLEGTLESEYKSDDECGGHAMLLYGWDETGWKIQNSWGTWWGDAGTCVLPFEHTDKVYEYWGLGDDIYEDGTRTTDYTEPFSSTLGEIIAHFLNGVANFFGRIFSWWKKFLTKTIQKISKTA